MCLSMLRACSIELQLITRNSSQSETAEVNLLDPKAAELCLINLSVNASYRESYGPSLGMQF